jgi:neutral ceramidase
MILRKALRYLLLTLVGVVAFFVILMIFSVAPVDRTNADLLPSYDTTMKRIEALDVASREPSAGFSVGFGKTNITPSEPVPTAGYGKRMGKPYHSVHDSIFVRAMVITNGVKKVAIVSADLLIMPPTVTALLDEKLRAIGFSLDNTYLGATHSHNSIGQWGEGATRIIYGDYDASVVNFIADGIVSSVKNADEDVLPATLKSGRIAVPHAVENRLIDDGPEDPMLRAIEIVRADGTTGVMLSFPAHATCLSQGTLELSRDFPGVVVDELESKGYTFAMYLAGAVGSHKGSAPAKNWSCMTWMADQLTQAFISVRDSLQPIRDSSVVMARVPLALSEPQVKISEDWKIRGWLFRAAFGEYENFLTVLRLGDLIMLGTPCDFSGELMEPLDSLATRLDKNVLVTSFNGGYIGYVTRGKYYDVDHYETRLMNWYAPGTGEYLTESLKKLMLVVSDTN